MIKEAIKKLSYFLFPKRCEICGDVVEFDVDRCDDCKHLDHISGDICELCGHKKEDCVCKKHKKEYKRIVAPYYYVDKLIIALHRLKFSNFQELAIGMGMEISNCVKQRYNDIDFDYITYIPMSKKSLSKRGYNQAQLLANEVSKHIGVESKQLLIKVFETKSQRTQNAKQRRVNVYGAFDLIYNIDISDKTILIIDDVKTTGSTLNECAKMLNIYGAKAVYAATFAIAKSNNPKD